TFGGRDSFIHKMSQPGAPPINSRPIESRSAISTKVFPNPTNGYSTLTLGQDAVDATIHIYNLSGQLLKSDIHVTGNNLKLDFSSYSPGMYMVEINDGNQSSIIKVMRVE
ncbi:MAG: T9SS type A sorting domain-containing protein, partial [Saprospiraceae bacterium]